MTAFDELVTALIAGGMSPPAAAALVARATIEISQHSISTRSGDSSGAKRMRSYRARRAELGMQENFNGVAFRPSLKERDGEQCAYCAATTDLVIDHAHPIAQGGTDDLDNLVFACRPCNGGKSGRTPEQAGMTFVVDSARVAYVRFVARTKANSSQNAPLSILTSSSEGSTEEKKERGVDVLSTEPRARAKREKRERTRMTEDWYPSSEGMKFAADYGLRLFEIEIEITKFRNYWINRGDLKPRWDLAWQNWILNVKGTLNERSGRNRPHSVAESSQTHGDAVVAGVARFAARYHRDKSANSGGTVQGRDDPAGGTDADTDAEGSDQAPFGQPRLLLTGNA